MLVLFFFLGVWYMHCHYELHVSIGMAAVFIIEDGPTVDSALPPPPVDFHMIWAQISFFGFQAACTVSILRSPLEGLRYADKSGEREGLVWFYASEC